MSAGHLQSHPIIGAVDFLLESYRFVQFPYRHIDLLRLLVRIGYRHTVRYGFARQVISAQAACFRPFLSIGRCKANDLIAAPGCFIVIHKRSYERKFADLRAVICK